LFEQHPETWNRSLMQPIALTSIRDVLEAYKSAVLAKDVAGLMQLYVPDVRIFDAWGVWSYEGSAAWKTSVAGWFGSLGTERVLADFDDVQITGSDQLAMVTAIGTYAALSPAGDRLRAMQNRMMWVLRAAGDGWRIVHEHTSAPIGFDDAKAILQREPVS
jgi:uncharacterized protein (TIGR02246 family)